LQRLDALLLVADGMGGERAGDRASRMAAEGVRSRFASEVYREWPEFRQRLWEPAVAERVVREVNQEIFAVGERDPELRGLGTTVVMALVSGRRLTVAHVGDSRCYRVRDDAIELLTTDHSWVAVQVAAGLLDAEEARRHPYRNVLTRSLGDALPPRTDVRIEDWRDGDLLILCSDGLTGEVRDREILARARSCPDPRRLADSLVRLANDKDGSDNVTVLVGRCRNGSAPSG
jgi:protein phosphatase